MKRWISTALILFTLALLFASRAGAQGNTVNGQVLGLDGNPLPDATITIKNDMGRTFTTKTDKNGKYLQVGVPDGSYVVTLSHPSLPQPYTTKFQSGPDTPWNINLKALLAAAGNGAAGANAAADAAAKAFTAMKTHFEDATKAMDDGDTLKKSLASAPADQKADITGKINADYQTAITEFSAAEQGVAPKDTKNHALIFANLGRAQSNLTKYDDSAASYQKAVDLNPMPDYYSDLSTSLVNAGEAQKDPAVLQQRLTDADAACQKAVSLAGAAPPASAGGAGAPAAAAPAGLSPTAVAARCYKNMGIVLTNKGDLKDAIDPLKKATDANPKDALTWYLLGSAYLGSAQSKTVAGKEVFDFDPNTGASIQKCIDLDPTGGVGAQCKDLLDGFNQMSGGVNTSIGTAPKKKK